MNKRATPNTTSHVVPTPSRMFPTPSVATRLAKAVVGYFLITMLGITLCSIGMRMNAENEYCETTCKIHNCTITEAFAPTCYISVNATLEVPKLKLFYAYNDSCKIGTHCDICGQPTKTCYLQRGKILFVNPIPYGMIPIALGAIISAVGGFMVFAIMIVNAELWVPKFIYDWI